MRVYTNLGGCNCRVRYGASDLTLFRAYLFVWVNFELDTCTSAKSSSLFSWRALDKALEVPQKTDLGARVRLFVVCLYGNSPEDHMVIVPKVIW